VTNQLRRYYEWDLLIPLDLALAAAQMTEGAEEIVEELLQARSLVWAALDGYTGAARLLYGRREDMPRGFHQVPPVERLPLRMINTRTR
jgi:hypothetical protein